MKTSGNTVLVTGGGSGIGLALAERFLQTGNEVIVCGRREGTLKEAQRRFPKLHTRVCDVGHAADRESLVRWVVNEFPRVNVLVNNAGIQNRINLRNATEDWDTYRQEININVDGPIHLSLLLTPHLVAQADASIINISSGLAITPATWAPIYSAAKAALHSFTMSLRRQLADTSVRVVEVFPPAVNTDLGGPGLHTFGAPLNEFADSVFRDIQKGDLEIGYGGTLQRLYGTKEENEQAAQQMWDRFISNNPGM